MSESDSFSSLQALVDSHLSKTSMQNNVSDDVNGLIRRLPLPTLTGEGSPSSGTHVPYLPASFSGRLPLPTFNYTESPITNVLAQQVSNMYKAKELRRQQEEAAKLAEKMKKLEVEDNNDCLIDLRIAINKDIGATCGPGPPSAEGGASISSSLESLLEAQFMNGDYGDYTPERAKTPEPILPCITDMSFILKCKVRSGKCSAFGKVLTSRLRRVAAPYLREEIKTDIVRFDFKTMSPCDIIKEKLRRPTISLAAKPIRP